MSQATQYEDVVLGSGAGGKLLAWHLARSGRRVAVVERKWIGGSCPNTNCLPSKNEIWSAKVADLLHHAAQFGIVTGSVSVDMAKVRQRKREMVEGLVAVHLELYQKSGTELIMGDGRFVAPKTLEVRLCDGGTRVLSGERVFLNTGTRATIPPVAGLVDARPLTHIEALELDRLPAHLIVLGGGYVGLELAQAYRRFGSRVTVVALPMSRVLRAQTTGETRGFMKALLDARTDRIVGFTMFGPEAGEVMAVVQMAMLAGMPYTGLRDAILAHPTMAEGLNALFSEVPPSSAD